MQYVRGGEQQYVTATSPSLQYTQPAYAYGDGYGAAGGYAGYAGLRVIVCEAAWVVLGGVYELGC